MAEYRVKGQRIDVIHEERTSGSLRNTLQGHRVNGSTYSFKNFSRDNPWQADQEAAAAEFGNRYLYNGSYPYLSYGGLSPHPTNLLAAMTSGTINLYASKKDGLRMQVNSGSLITLRDLPIGVAWVFVELQGRGGNGRHRHSITKAGYGGGGGAYAYLAVRVASGASIRLTVKSSGVELLRDSNNYVHCTNGANSVNAPGGGGLVYSVQSHGQNFFTILRSCSGANGGSNGKDGDSLEGVDSFYVRGYGTMFVLPKPFLDQAGGTSATWYGGGGGACQLNPGGNASPESGYPMSAMHGAGGAGAHRSSAAAGQQGGPALVNIFY